MPQRSSYPAAEQDYDFLYRLHYLTFYDYVRKTWGTTEPAFEAAFRAEFDRTTRRVLCLDGQPVGSLVVEENGSEMFIDYIAILPEYQNQGYGTESIRSVLEAAEKKRIAVRLHVLKANPARALYERLGFRIYDEDDVRYYMERL